MPVPQGGAIAAMPTPQVAPPPNVDDVASPTQTGFRTGMKSLGAAMNNLLGQTGEALGATEFAADRFKDAENYTKSMETDTGIKDWGQVKDFTTLTHFVGNLVGKGAATMVPAIGASAVLRRPVLGTAVGFGAPGAGEQVAKLREDPVVMANTTPGERLGNAAATGAIQGGLYATVGAPGQFVRKVAGQAVKESAGAGIAKAAAGQAVAMPAADVAGQEMHQQLNPDKELDTSHLLEEAATGAVFGGVLGAAGHIPGQVMRGAAKTAGELKERFKKPEAPYDVDNDMPPKSVPDAKIEDWLKTQGEGTATWMKDKWQGLKEKELWGHSMEEFMADPEVRAEAVKDIKEKHYDTKVKPVLEGLKKFGKDFSETLKKKQDEAVDEDPNKPGIVGNAVGGIYMAAQKAREIKEKLQGKTKFSEMNNRRTATDTDILQAVAKHLPEEFTSRIPPEELRNVADIFKTLAEDPEHFAETGVPHMLRQELGHEEFRTVMKEVQKIVGTDNKPVEKMFKTVAGAEEAQINKVRDVIHQYAKDEHLANPDNAAALMDDAAPWLLKELHSGKTDPEFKAKFAEVFGEGKEADSASKALERIAKDKLTSDEAFKSANKGEADVQSESEASPAHDKRLDQMFNDTPDGLKKAQALREELEVEFGRKNAEVSIKRSEDGKLSLHLENADHVGLNKTAFERAREDPKYNRSKLSEGIISVITDEHKSGVKVNLMRLTSEMMRRETPSDRPGTDIDYVRDMFARGMTALLNTGSKARELRNELETATKGRRLEIEEELKNLKEFEVRGFTKSGKEQLIRKTAAGTWDLPDNTPVARMHDKTYTYGEIKKYKISRKELRGITDEDIQASKAALLSKGSDLSEGALHLKAVEDAIQKSHDKAMEKTLLDPLDLRKEDEANGSKPTDKSRDPEGARTYEEDLGATATQLNAPRVITTEKAFFTPKEGGPYKGDVSTSIKAPAFAEPVPKVEKGTPKPTVDRLIDQAEADSLKPKAEQIDGALDLAKLKDNEVVWAVTDPEAEVESGKVLAVFKDIGKAQAYADKVGGNVENNLAKNLREKPKFSDLHNLGKEPISPETEKAVRDYVTKVLGPDAKVLFEKMDHAGSFANLKGVETLKISIDAMDPMSTGHHEAVHAFFARLMKADPKAAHTLTRAAEAPAIIARLRTLLKDHPKALEQLKDPEERLAYMYQFSAAGKKGLINLGPETKTWFEKAKGFFRKVAAIWADDMATASAVDKAGDILSAFHNGEFAERSTVAQVLHDKFPRSALEATEQMMPWASRFMNKFLFTATGSVRDMNISPLTSIMDKFHTSVEAQGKEPGFIQAKVGAFNSRINKVADIFATMPDKERQKVVWDDLHTGEPAKTAEGKKIQALLEEVHSYMYDRGVMHVFKDPTTNKMTMEPLQHIKNYFPRVYNQDLLRTPQGKSDFIELLTKHGVPDPLDVYTKITRDVDASKPQDIDITYYTPQTAERALKIPDSELKPFFEKDLFGTLSQYLHRAVRRAEYTERFGNMGEGIVTARDKAKAEGATAEQLKTFDDSVMAMEGTLGANMDPKLKNIYSGLMTYQNIRLLPLQIFASLIDPLGIVVRGGSVKEAGVTFAKGMRDLVTLGKYKEDNAYELAKTIGAIDVANDRGLMSDMYGSEYMPKLQRNINDKFFRYNGMEMWNNRMRAQAAVAAENFIDKHMNRPNEHSERFLAELDLKKGDKLSLDSPKYVRALNKWVDEAILRPNAALRPVYMSDPNWMLISHLKQYTYQFQKVIIARTYHEMAHGNYTPAVALASYVPGMIAADMLKVNLTPGNGDDNARAGWDTADYVGHGLQRVGLFGPSQLGLDAAQDTKRGGIGIESAAGPTIQQLLDFVKGGTQGHLGTQLEKAVPGYQLIKPAGGHPSKAP